MIGAVGSYQLLAEIGRGGTGVVYLARKRNGPEVALKLVTPWADMSDVHGLKRELGIQSKLVHRRIVRVLDSGVAAGRPYLVAEYVPGGSLRDFLNDQGAASPAQAVVVVNQVAEALDFAHSRGVIHRDIKPDNVYLDGRGGVKLGDFGLAKPSEGGQTVTVPGTLAGSPAYMSPEQIAGAKRLSPASDVYQLGVLAYELLTGYRPFEGQTYGILLYKVLHDEPTNPRDLLPSLNEETCQVLLWALAKDPAQRPLSAGALARHLRAAAGVKSQHLPSSVLQPLLRGEPNAGHELSVISTARNRLGAGPRALRVLLLVLCLILLGLLGMAGWMAISDMDLGVAPMGRGGAYTPGQTHRTAPVAGVFHSPAEVAAMMSPDTILIASVDLRQALRSPLCQRLSARVLELAAAEDRSFQKQLAEFTAVTAIRPLYDIDRILLVVEEDPGQEPSLAILSEGTWDQARMRRFLEKVAGQPPNLQAVAGKVLFTWGKGSGTSSTPSVGGVPPVQTWAMAFPRERLMLIGRLPLVERLVLAMAGKAVPAADSSLRRALLAVDARGCAWAVGVLPKEVAREFQRKADSSGGWEQQLASITLGCRAFCLAVRPDGDGLDATLTAYVADGGTPDALRGSVEACRRDFVLEVEGKLAERTAQGALDAEARAVSLLIGWLKQAKVVPRPGAVDVRMPLASPTLTVLEATLNEVRDKNALGPSQGSGGRAALP